MTADVADLVEAFWATEKPTTVRYLEVLDNGEVFVEFTADFLGPFETLFALYYTVNYNYGYPLFVFVRDKYGVL